MAAGVQSQHIQTGTLLKLVEDNDNAWEDFAGSDIVGDSVYWTAPTTSPYDYEQTWWGYRGQAAMCSPAFHKGMTFDGVDDSIGFGDNYDFTTTSSFSVSFWINPSEYPTDYGYILSKDTTVSGWGIYLYDDGSIGFYRMSTTNTYDEAVTAAGMVPLDTWTQVTCIYWGANNLIIDINGVQRASIASTRSLPGNTAALTFGKWASGSSNYFTGKLWGVALWSKTLSPSERTSLYDSSWLTGAQYEAAVNAISTLSSYWRLSQYTSTMSDTSGAITGTVSGSPDRHTDGPFDVYSIVRVRNGNGTTSNRQIYYQTITDPTDTSQWTTWTSLYTGTWYAVAIYPDVTASAGYRVVHASSTAIYVDNTSKITVSNVVLLKPFKGFSPTAAGDLFYCVVGQNSNDSKRTMKWYYTTNVQAGTAATAWLGNYDWAHCDLACYIDSAGTNPEIVFSAPYFANNSRSQTDSDALLYNDDDSTTFNSKMQNGIRSLRGASSRAGSRQFNELMLFKDLVEDDYYYLFYTEENRDTVTTNSLANLRRPLIWQRAVDSFYGWSEPVPTGYSVWGFAGVEKVGNYLYAAGNGRVIRRPIAPVETDLSDYVIEGQVNIPRNNQKGTGTITLANPDNEVGTLLGVVSNQITTATEKRVDLQLGQQVFLNEGYEWQRNNDWWVAGVRREKSKDKNRISLKIEDFWHRLENKFRDTYYFPGEFSWIDWDTAGVNSLTNWFSPSGQTFSRVQSVAGDDTSQQLSVPSGKALFTPWKGHSFKYIYAGFTLTTHAATYVIFRWKDARNYYRIKYLTSTLYIEEVVNGTVNTLTSAAAGSTSSTNFTIKVEAYFNKIIVSFDNVVKITHTLATYRRFSGHAGAWSAGSNWKLVYWSIADVEAWVPTAKLVQMALGYAGYLNVDIDDELANVDQLSILWGPQTDIESPAQAIEKLLEGNELQLTCRWVEDVPWVYISQFASTEADYSITDDIIDFSHTEEAKEAFNVVMVDGNEFSWTEFYRPDLTVRGRTVTEYLDIPELLTQGAVQARAAEVLDKALKANSPGGTTVWRPWYNRLDTVTWTDEFGENWAMRIEGLSIEWNQSLTPFQRAEIDGGPLLLCSPDDEEKTYSAQDSFTRVSTNSWGSADTGGAWTLTGTASLWQVADGVATVAPVAGTPYLATLGGISAVTTYVQYRGSMDKTSVTGYQTVGVLVHYIDSSNWLNASLYLDVNGLAYIRIRKALAGVQTVVMTVAISDFVYTPGEDYKLQAKVTADTLSAKVWKADESEPSEYAVEYSITDSALQATGAIGIRAVLSSAATDTPVTFTFDDYEAWT